MSDKRTYFVLLLILALLQSPTAFATTYHYNTTANLNYIMYSGARQTFSGTGSFVFNDTTNSFTMTLALLDISCYGCGLYDGVDRSPNKNVELTLYGGHLVGLSDGNNYFDPVTHQFDFSDGFSYSSNFTVTSRSTDNILQSGHIRLCSVNAPVQFSSSGSLLTAEVGFFGDGFKPGDMYLRQTFEYAGTNIPEPASLALFAVGTLGAAMIKKRITR